MNLSTKVEDYHRAARIHRGLAFFYILIVLAFSYMGITSGDWTLSIFFGLLFLIHFSTYSGLMRDRLWAKVLSGILAFALLFGFPIGTILGGFILYYMYRVPSVQANESVESSADAPVD